MQKSHKIFFIIPMLILLSSCYKDLGNYDYNAINTPVIQLEKSYTGFYGKNISITPVINLSQDEVANTYDTSKYSFEWSTINAAALFASQRVVLARTRDLNTALSVPPANGYTLYVRMTDKKSGIQWTAQATLNVVTNIYEGWLVLNDVNTKSRLDMITLLNGSYTFLPGVLDSVNSGLSMDAKPIGVFYSPQAAVLSSTLTQGIYVSTAAGTNRIDPENFKWDPLLNIKYQMLSNVPADFAAEIITPAPSWNEYMYSGNNVYYYYRINQINYGVPLNIMTGEATAFKAAPFMAVSKSNGAVFYDMIRKRFVRQAFSATVCTLMPTGTLFDYTTNMDLVYMEYTGYNGGEVFAVLKNASTGKYYLARFTYGASIQQTYYSEMTATSFDNAEQFAVSPDFGYLFYNVGGKVYEYDMGLKQSKLMFDKGASNPVTVLKFQHFTGGKYLSGTTALYNKLVVGSYNNTLPAASCGTMDIYTVPGVNGNLVLDNSYSGLGKPVSITYRER